MKLIVLNFRQKIFYVICNIWSCSCSLAFKVWFHLYYILHVQTDIVHFCAFNVYVPFLPYFLQQQRRRVPRQILHVRTGSASQPAGDVMENPSVQMVQMKQTPPAVSSSIKCVRQYVVNMTLIIFKSVGLFQLKEFRVYPSLSNTWFWLIGQNIWQYFWTVVIIINGTQLIYETL